MARLHESSDDGEEFPELSAILQSTEYSNDRLSSGKAATVKLGKEQEVVRKSPNKRGDNVSRRSSIKNCSLEPSNDASIKERQEKQVGKQKSLRLAHIDSLLLPTLNFLMKLPPDIQNNTLREDRKSTRVTNRSPRSQREQKINYSRFDLQIQDTITSSSEEEYQNALSDLDSGNDLENKTLRPESKHYQWSSKNLNPVGGGEVRHRGRKVDDLRVGLQQPVSSVKSSELVPDKHSRSKMQAEENAWENGNVCSEDSGANLSLYAFFPRLSLPAQLTEYSIPPKSKSPQKKIKEIRFTTPPPSPSKAKLQSPSKSYKIPPSPHRPSIDAFWSQETINEWNDQYSPKKTPRSKRLFTLNEDDTGDLSPSKSLPKSPCKSPAKKDKQAIQKKKLFDEKKNDLAVSFLQELDQRIGNRQVSSLASSTGGIHIVWSKKLNSTAGRANWRRETLRSKNAEGVVVATSYRHHASIELAEKVIDSEGK